MENISLEQKTEGCRLNSEKLVTEAKEAVIKKLLQNKQYTDAGRLSRKIKRYALASKCYEKAGEEEEYMALECAKKARMPHRARRLLERIVEKLAKKEEGSWQAGDLLITYGDLKRASEFYIKGFEFYQKSKRNLDQEEIKALDEIYNRLREEDMNKEALVLAEKLKEFSSTWMSNAIWTAKAMGLVDKVLSLSEEELEKSNGSFHQAISYNCMARYAEEQGRYDIAIESYLKATGKFEKILRRGRSPDISLSQEITLNRNYFEDLRDNIESALRVAEKSNELEVATQIRDYIDFMGIYKSNSKLDTYSNDWRFWVNFHLKLPPYKIEKEG